MWTEPLRRTACRLGRAAQHALGATCTIALGLALWPALGQAATYVSASTPYSLIDSSSHTKVGYNTTPYKFNFATGCGVAPPVLDDALSDAIPIGFNFVFGGTTYSSARIMTNGRLQFGNVTCGYGTQDIGPPQTYPYPLPDANMNGVMKIFGVDLDATNLVDQPNYPSAASKTPCTSSATCYISVATLGSAPSRKFVVTWKKVPEWVSASNTSGSFDLQIILNENGSFVFQYGTISHGGTGTAQIGWQASTTDYAVLSFGAAAEPPANTAIAFYIPAPIAGYYFDEQAWATGVVGPVSDSSGGGRHGAALGGTTAVASGKVCRAADIPANTTAAKVDAVMTGVDLSDSAVSMQGSGTAAFWYRSNAAWNSNAPAQLLDAATTSGQWFYLARTSTGSLYFQVTDSTGVLRSVETPAQSFAANTWVHVAIAWDFNGAAGSNQDSLRIWINGATPTVSSFTSNGTLSTSVRTLYLGDNPSGFTGTKGSVSSANGQIDEANFYNSPLSTAQLGTLISASRSCGSLSLHHLELQHATGTGVTCTPSLITVRACQDAACTAAYTGGVNANLTASGSPTVAYDSSTGGAAGAAFVLPLGYANITKGVQITTPGSVLLGTANESVPFTSARTCNFGSPSCTLSAADAGFVVTVPHHVSESVSAATISAVKKSDSSLACVPAFASVTKPIQLSCAYNNPSSGTLPLRISGTALNASANNGAACDAGGRSVNLSFNASGVASPSLVYADVGQLTLTARYTGSAASNDNGLVMTGGASFVVAPASFGFSAISAAPLTAGTAFSATVSARNAAGATTPNFGRESPSAASASLAFTRKAPTGAGASNGVFSGSLGAFSAGSATAGNLVWTEVGSGDLAATLVGGNYLGSGLTVSGSTGSTGAVGRFIPHHFDVAVTPACSGSFSYAGQMFAVRVTARNGLAAPGTTLNYDGSVATSPNQALQVSLADVPKLNLGTLNATSVAVASFVAGVADTQVSYDFSNKLTAPQTLVLRASNADGVRSTGWLEGNTLLRSGRLRLSNAFGSSSRDLAVPITADYWTGQAWLPNADDNCTVLAPDSVALSNPRNHLGNTSPAATKVTALSWSNGSGTITLLAPDPVATASFDLALNLGKTANDQSCQASHPASSGANLPWLRSLNGSCAASADRDPAARASFGIYKPETRKSIHSRELF